MKRNTKMILLSSTVILLLSSTVYAGKILTDAEVNDINVTTDQQFGFGGWNFDNVDVRIVDTSDFSTALPGTGFDTLTGSYQTMDYNQSYESDIKDVITGTVMGHLHGKDWPVGEPAGIKIINDDTNVKHGKPVNCIMTSSYLAFTDDTNTVNGYLDGDTPSPVLCSGDWQTHKRYKINLLPSTVDGVIPGNYAKPVDLVFNLDPDDDNTTIRRYQVLQKVNNYTDMRLDGYKVEVLDEAGEKNPALTFSLGLGEGDDGGDIWESDDMANYSHGLWGPYEEGRFDNGFFDYLRAYYPVELSDDNQTISYFGDMLGGNYQAIFGNWLPSLWEPMGIFHDDDQDPETDGILKAFLGVAPGHTERAWYKSSVDYNASTPGITPVYTWLEATEQDLLDWSGDWYDEGPVEDVLNLGLNYIINIGKNADIGSTFTLRITPHVDTNQTAPSSYEPPVTMPPSIIVYLLN